MDIMQPQPRQPGKLAEFRFWRTRIQTDAHTMDMPARTSNKKKETEHQQSTGREDIQASPAGNDSPRVATLTKSVYEQLRADVLSGKLRPGEKLGAEALRTRFKTGSSPVREALNRLLSEGLVALEEQKGFRVAPVSREELSELVTARCWIDGAAITESIKRFDTSWEESLVLAQHRLTKSHRSEPAHVRNLEWEARHKAFHMALVSGCGTRWLIRISEQLFDAAERYRLLGADYVPECSELDEHRAMVAACFERDTDKVVELLKRHYGRTFEVIARSLIPSLPAGQP
jgi:GntR family transcriptional regulator, carbon starvation induced regulator